MPTSFRRSRQRDRTSIDRKVHTLFARFIIIFLKTASVLPLRALHGIGSGIGWILAVFPDELREITRSNLRICFPGFDAGRLRELERDSLKETCKGFMELAVFWGRKRPDSGKFVRQVNGGEILDSAFKAGRGVIVLVPHLGSWEFLAHYLALNYPLTGLFRPLRMPSLHGFVLAGRQRAGARLVPTTPAGIRSLFRALQNRELVAILPDQDPGRDGSAFAPFFGVQASTMLLVSRLARRSGSEVVATYALRLPRGGGYDIFVRKVPEEIKSVDKAISAAVLNKAVEGCVREVPGQYLWSYKRFKTRPEGDNREIYHH